MTGEFLLGKGADGSPQPAGMGRRGEPGTSGGFPGWGRGWGGSKGRARVGDAGVFHERAFWLCRASRPSARSSARSSRMGLGVVRAHSVFQISFVNCGEIPLLPLRCKDKTSWEEHQSSVSRLPQNSERSRQLIFPTVETEKRLSVFFTKEERG